MWGLGQPFTQWRNYLARVIDTINFHQEKTYRSSIRLLEEFFTRPTVTLPQTPAQLYRFQINQKVRLDASPRERRRLGFKYTLNRG
jgi:hypothetical protein